MFITCQECNTTFRLDERLLKPTGSKVRCSQCLHTFTAKPPSLPRPVDENPEIDTPSTDTAMMLDGAEEAQAHELEGIDLAELDAILEGDDTSKKPASASDLAVDSLEADSGEELDLDLDFDFDALEPEEADPTQAPAVEEEAADDLDLEMDFEIEDEAAETKAEIADSDLASASLQETAGAQAPAGEANELQEPTIEADLDMALEGLSLNPGQDDGRVASAAETNTADDMALDDLDLDLSEDDGNKPSDEDEPELSLAEDSDLAMEASAPEEAPLSAEDQEPDLDELDLDLEGLPKDEGVKSQDDQKAVEDLGLSDLDAMLDFEDRTEEKNATDQADLPAEDDLALELDLEGDDASEPASSGGANTELEEFEFELDSEFEDKPAVQKAPVDSDDALPEDDEIDLSDIEEMLGSDVSADAPSNEAPAADEDLSLSGDADEIDLSEIEAAIDQAEEAGLGPNTIEEPELELELDSETASSSPADAAPEDVQLDLTPGNDESSAEELDLDLELEFESDAKTGGADAAPSESDEIDMSDLADLVDDQEHGAKTEVVDGGDIELEFQIEEDEERQTAAEPEPSRTAGKTPAAPFDETMEAAAVEEKLEPKVFKPKRKGSRKGLVALLVILILAGAGYGVYYAVTQLGIEIPYISDYLKPKPADPNGILNLSTLNINSKFIQNNQSGRLFVITGKVRNGYATPRNAIRLVGKLFTKGKVLIKTEYSHAGALISDQDLANLSIAEIKQRLNQDAAATVQPGQEIPFMLVFSDLPPANQLDEFAVQLVGSSPAAKKAR